MFDKNFWKQKKHICMKDGSLFHHSKVKIRYLKEQCVAFIKPDECERGLNDID